MFCRQYFEKSSLRLQLTFESVKTQSVLGHEGC